MPYVSNSSKQYTLRHSWYTKRLIWCSHSEKKIFQAHKWNLNENLKSYSKIIINFIGLLINWNTMAKIQMFVPFFLLMTLSQLSNPALSLIVKSPTLLPTHRAKNNVNRKSPPTRKSSTKSKPKNSLITKSANMPSYQDTNNNGTYDATSWNFSLDISNKSSHTSAYGVSNKSSHSSATGIPNEIANSSAKCISNAKFSHS